MTGKGGKRSSSGARAGAPSAKSGAQAVSGTPQTPQTPRAPAGFEPLVTQLGGGNVAVQSDYVPWADHGGTVRGIIILFEDVTDERVAERALRESEERFRRIANSAPALMWVTRIDRVRDFVNDAYAEFVCGPDCDPDEARTLDWRSRIHPDDVERIVAESIAGEASD